MDEDFDLILYPIAEEEVGGHPRDKSPDQQQVLLQRGDYLTTKAEISLLAHGKLATKGPDASLLVVDFRFGRTHSSRFVWATMRLTFRDTQGDNSKNPEVYMMAPEDAFTLDPGKETWKITQVLNASLNVGTTPVGGSAGGSLQREGEKVTEHGILLTGMSLVGSGSYKKNEIRWTLNEDSVKHKGIPAILRTAVILRRTPGRAFKIEVEVQTEVNKRQQIKNFFSGQKEYSVPLEDIVVDADKAEEVVEGRDADLVAFAEKATWDSRAGF